MKNLSALQITLLKKSFRHLPTDKVATEFYEKLFTRYPEVRAMFPTDMKELEIKLMSVCELVIFSFEEKETDQYRLQDALIIPLRELGRQHDDKGVMPEHYTIANQLLIDTLRNQVGEQFSSEVRTSWELALEHLTCVMLDRSGTNRKNETGSLRATFTNLIKTILHK